MFCPHRANDVLALFGYWDIHRLNEEIKTRCLGGAGNTENNITLKASIFPVLA
jgi:hypothetical protein